MTMKLTSTIAATTGILGSLLVAIPTSIQWGFALFLVSNLGWLAFSAAHKHRALFVQQLFFLGTSSLGLWNWWAMGA